MPLQVKSHRRESQDKSLALKEATKEETHRLNVDIPISLYQRIRKHIAVQTDKSTIKTHTIRAFEEYLDKYSNE